MWNISLRTASWLLMKPGPHTVKCIPNNNNEYKTLVLDDVLIAESDAFGKVAGTGVNFTKYCIGYN